MNKNISEPDLRIHWSLERNSRKKRLETGFFCSLSEWAFFFCWVKKWIVNCELWKVKKRKEKLKKNEEKIFTLWAELEKRSFVDVLYLFDFFPAPSSFKVSVDGKSKISVEIVMKSCEKKWQTKLLHTAHNFQLQNELLSVRWTQASKNFPVFPPTPPLRPLAFPPLSVTSNSSLSHWSEKLPKKEILIFTRFCWNNGFSLSLIYSTISIRHFPSLSVFRPSQTLKIKRKNENLWRPAKLSTFHPSLQLSLLTFFCSNFSFPPRRPPRLPNGLKGKEFIEKSYQNFLFHRSGRNMLKSF